MKVAIAKKFKISKPNIFDKIRGFFKYTFRFGHMKIVKEALFGRPYDFGYLLNLEYYKLKEMLAYFSQATVTTDEVYADICRWLKIAISLNEIIRNDVDYWHIEGFPEFKENDNDSYDIDTSETKIVCDRYVNMKNSYRFIPDYCKDYIIKNDIPELYRLKAKHLYYEILKNKIEFWWD